MRFSRGVAGFVPGTGIVRWMSVGAGLAALSLSSAASFAQVTPDRTYYGVGRPVPVSVNVPADKKGEASLQLFTTGATESSGKAVVTSGPADLAQLFPQLWSTPDLPLYYAQLVVGDEKIGAPLVIQPLRNPQMAMGNPQTGAINWRATGDRKASGIRAYVEKHVVMKTDQGDIELAMRPDQAPNTCWSFMELVRGGYYTDQIFHRIIGPQNGKPGFMAQGGDPTGTGGGGPGFNIDLEPSKLPHDFGVISMARTGDPNTNGSQFFLCFSREGTSFLDNNYCAFGQAVKGGEVIEKLEKTEVLAGGEGSKPKVPPKILSCSLVDAPPFGTGPKAVQRSSDAPKAPGR